MSDEEPRCEHCGEVVGDDSPAWVELASGRLRIVVLGDYDDPEPYRRVWHAQCFGL
jgi:hypothetical protein